MLLLFGGVLAAEFLDDLARLAARPPRFASRRPLLFGAALLALLAVVALAHDVLARGMYLVRPESPVALAFGTATFALYASLAAVLALLLLAWAGSGREAMPRRALYAVAFLYLVGWLVGYTDGDALGALGATSLPLLAVGIAAVEFCEILFEAPERMAQRALPREALWDLFLALSFGAIFLLSTFGLGGQDASRTVFEVKAVTWLGFVAGALLVPLARWRAARQA